METRVPLPVITKSYKQLFGGALPEYEDTSGEETIVQKIAESGTVCPLEPGAYVALAGLVRESELTSAWSLWTCEIHDLAALICEPSTQASLGIFSEFFEEGGAVGPAPEDNRAQVVAPPSTVPQRIYELRRLTGLSWEQLAEMLDVTRRTIHNWAAGKEIALKNDQRLGRTLAVVREIDRGNAADNRRLLLAPVREGRTLQNLFREENFDLILLEAGKGPGRPEKRVTPVDERTLQLLAPRPFSEVLEAIDEAGEGAEAATPRKSEKKRKPVRLAKKGRRERRS